MIRPFQKILEPDDRFRAFVRFDDQTPMTLEDHYESMAPLELRATVPKSVSMMFDRARAAYLYAWFAYELTTLAQYQACATVEVVLREKLEARYQGKSFKHLNGCLEKAIADGDLSAFRLRPGERIYTLDDLNALKDLLVHVRNLVAHGSEMVAMPTQALIVLEPCARLIDHCYGCRLP
ncbi:MAG: hypothetical protein H7124_01185 [Phycisphaerales bacterium]|nr:hypothetical protein [Hyphomonadaceae bacterium]